MARPSILGPAIYDRVVEMVETGMAKNQSEAMLKISEDPRAFGIPSDGKLGSIQANFYREKGKRQKEGEKPEKPKPQSKEQVVKVEEEVVEVEQPRVDWKLEDERYEQVPVTASTIQVENQAPQESVNKLALALIDSAHEIAELLQQRENENQELREKLARVSNALH